jgi:hypothetical protein
MCAPADLRQGRTRWMMILGNFALAAALLLGSMARAHTGAHPHPLIDGVSGLFFGVSIGANLMAVRCARRKQAAAPIRR